MKSVLQIGETTGGGDDGKPVEVKTVYGASKEDASAEFQVIVDRNGRVIADINDTYTGKDLSELVGEELAETLLRDGEQKAEGDGLRIGVNGMKGFYDDILPRFMNKYGKKWGVKVEDIELPNIGREGGLTMHSVKVTPEMKESVMGGQPMFSLVGNKENGTLAEVDKRLDEVSRLYQKQSSISENGNQGEIIPTEDGGHGGTASDAKISKYFDNSTLLPKIAQFVKRIEDVGDINADNFANRIKTPQKVRKNASRVNN